MSAQAIMTHTAETKIILKCDNNFKALYPDIWTFLFKVTAAFSEDKISPPVKIKTAKAQDT